MTEMEHTLGIPSCFAFSGQNLPFSSGTRIRYEISTSVHCFSLRMAEQCKYIPSTREEAVKWMPLRSNDSRVNSLSTHHSLL